MKDPAEHFKNLNFRERRALLNTFKSKPKRRLTPLLILLPFGLGFVASFIYAQLSR